MHRRYFIKAEGCLAGEFECPAGQHHGMGDQLLGAGLWHGLQMVEKGHFSWVLKTLNTCKTRSSHWEGHCLVPCFFTFCPEVQLNTDSTVGAQWLLFVLFIQGFWVHLVSGTGTNLC